MHLFEEKRDSLRLQMYIPVRCQYKSYNKFNFTLTRDIGEGGLKIVSEEFIPPNTEVILEFKLSPQTQLLRTIAKTVWIQQIRASERYNIGIEFLNISPEKKEEITHCIKREVFSLKPSV